MSAKLFETALGNTDPWLIESVKFDEEAKTLTILIKFKAESRFAVCGFDDMHGVPDTVTKASGHLNFFQHEFHLQVRTPRVKLLNSFTLLFEAFILMLCGQMPFAVVSRIAGKSPHRVLAVCGNPVGIACGLDNHWNVPPWPLMRHREPEVTVQ